ARQVSRREYPPAAVSAEMPGHRAARVAGVGIGGGGSAKRELPAMDADDRGVAGSGRLLAILAAALADEQGRSLDLVPDGAAQAAAAHRLRHTSALFDHIALARGRQWGKAGRGERCPQRLVVSPIAQSSAKGQT